MRHIGTKPLETQRLILRRFEKTDAQAMFDTWANDPAVTRWLRWEPHGDIAITHEVVDGWVAQYAHKDYYHWAIVLRAGQPLADGTPNPADQLIGGIGILHSLEEHGPDSYEPGYCIGRAYWGQGYTTEALHATLEYFIQGTGTTRLYCCHAVENPASGRVMQKEGFVYDHDGSYTKFDGTVIPAKYYVLNVFDRHLQTAAKQVESKP